MTRLIFVLCLLILPVAAFSQTFPQAQSSYVNDFANIIDAETERRITQDLVALRTDRGVEMTVVTIDRMSDYGARHGIRVFATALFNAWGIGDADQNNGVLFLVAKGDREMFISLGSGYPMSYDDRMDRVFDQHVKHHFQAENYALGVEKGVLETIKRTDADWTPPASNLIAEWGRNVIAILMVGFVVIAVFYKTMGDALMNWFTQFRKCPQCGNRTLERVHSTDSAVVDALGFEEEIITTTCRTCDYKNKTKRLSTKGRATGRFGRYGRNGISGGSSSGGGSFGGGGSSGGGGGGRW